MRIAVVGPFTWFENHFPERWRSDPEVLCLDVYEWDYSWLLQLHNFKPCLTLFYRPELYPSWYLKTLGGKKVAFLSEPLPSVQAGDLVHTDETRLRVQVYGNISWEDYDWKIYYDRGKREAVRSLRYPIDEFAPLPIDTDVFRPPRKGAKRPYDVCFVGKPTPHRIAKLDFLRSSSLKFIWVAHGISGRQLATLFRRSRVVLNVHADGEPAIEPRLYLGAACGALVVTEPLSSPIEYFSHSIVEESRAWTVAMLREHVTRAEAMTGDDDGGAELEALSTRAFIKRVFSLLVDRESADGRGS